MKNPVGTDEQHRDPERRREAQHRLERREHDRGEQHRVHRRPVAPQPRHQRAAPARRPPAPDVIRPNDSAPVWNTVLDSTASVSWKLNANRPSTSTSVITMIRSGRRPTYRSPSIDPGVARGDRAGLGPVQVGGPDPQLQQHRAPPPSRR